MKKYIQIASFQLSFFFSNLHVYISLGPEKEGVHAGGLGRVGVEVQPWSARTHAQLCRKKVISENP